MMRISSCAVLFVFVLGCGASGKDKKLGTIDLSTAGSTCNTAFRWNQHFPGLAFVVRDGKGNTHSTGQRPDWPLALQLDILDAGSGAKVASSIITKEQMVFANWHLPDTCFLYNSPNTQKWERLLVPGHSYDFTVTVLQPVTGLGNAEVDMHWVEGSP